jgi:hypothetical protein
MKSSLLLKTSIIALSLLWHLQAMCNSLRVPPFLVNVSRGHFAGVSDPCKSLAEARKSATYDAARQILGSIDSRYDHHLLINVSGNPKSPQKTIHDNFLQVASGIVLGVEQNIIENAWQMDDSGKYIYFVLVRYPDSLITEMKRLSKGSKVVASFVRWSGDEAVIRVTELNGVSAILTSADIKICKRNRYAKAISFFIVRVPEVSNEKCHVALRPVKVCAESKTIRLRLTDGKKASDYLLGAAVTHNIELRGYDEIGRAVRAHVGF